MSRWKKFQGAATAIVTPFKKDESVDEQALRSHRRVSDQRRHRRARTARNNRRKSDDYARRASEEFSISSSVRREDA